MSQRSSFLTRPFKFVVVGECGSGKSTLIKRLLSGFKGEKYELDDDLDYKPTFVCDGHTLSLTTTVKLVCKDGRSVPLKNDEITRQLWRKNFSKSSSSLPEALKSGKEQDDISWDDIFVYLHRPRKRVVVKQRIRSESACQNPTIPAASSRNSHPQSRNPQVLHAKSTACQYLPPGSPRKQRQSETNSVELDVDVWDTGGDKSLLWYRWYACTGADAVLLCVPLSFILHYSKSKNGANDPNLPGAGVEVVKTLSQFLSDEFLSNKTKKVDYRVPPVILVGTKSDECKLPSKRLSFCDESEDDTVDDIGLKLASEIGCCDFIHCSGLKGSGVTSVFETALAVSLTNDGKYRATMSKCGESLQNDGESSFANEVLQPTYFKVHRNDSQTTSTSSGATCSTPRSPPVIHFPPPPEFSPSLSDRSTQTDEEVSRESSPQSPRYGKVEDSATSTESSPRMGLEARNFGNFEIRTLTTRKDTVGIKMDANQQDSVDGCFTIPLNLNEHTKQDMKSNASDVSGKLPTPKPRRKLYSNPDMGTESPLTSISQHSTTLPRDHPRISPVPKPRGVLSSPKRNKIPTKCRQDDLFVKFLRA